MSVRVVLILVLAAVLGARAAPSPVRELEWVTRRLATPFPANAEPELRLLDAKGRTACTSRNCQILSQAGEHWITGTLPDVPPGTYRLELVARAPDDRELERRTLEARYQIQARTFDVALLLDASRSMIDNDPNDLRADAVHRFQRLARDSRRIETLSLVVFHRQVKASVRPTPPNKIERLDRVLRTLRPYGSTDFDTPFAAALDLLADTAAQRRVAIFLSDGHPHQKYQETHREFAKRGWPVYTIGLSDQADARLLTRIAEETGGAYFPARTPEQLSDIFATIFHRIETPVSVFSATVRTPPETTLRFRLDSTLHNPMVLLAPLAGTPNATWDNRIPITPEPGELPVLPVPDATPGPHTITLTGQGRTRCEILADTDFTLDTLALNVRAPTGLPLLLHFHLTGSEHTTDLTPSCEIRMPDGTARALPATRDRSGGFTLTVPQTRQPGLYLVTLQVTAQLNGKPVQRTATLRFTRTGEDTPEAVEASPERTVADPAKPLSDDQDRVLSPVPELADSRPTTGPDGPRATLRVEPGEVRFDGLAPGASRTVSLRVLPQSPGASRPQVALVPAAGNGVALALHGQLQPNRESMLEIAATAGTHSAGQPVEAALRFVMDGCEWSVPVAGRVTRPTLIVEPGETALRVQDSRLRVETEIAVRLEGAGRCDVTVETDAAEAALRPTAFLLEHTPQTVRCADTVPMPDAPTPWEATVRVQGPGLEPVEVVLTTMLEPLSGRNAAPVVPMASAPRSRLPLVFLAVAAIVVLLALLLSALRGSRRSAFILVSIMLHLVVLFLVVPRSTLEELAESAVGTLTVNMGSTVSETRIAPESDAGATHAREAQPLAAAKRETPLPELEEPDPKPQPVEPLVPLPEPEVKTEAEPAPDENVKRQAMTPEELQADDPTLEAKRHEVVERPNRTPTDAAATPVATPETTAIVAPRVLPPPPNDASDPIQPGAPARMTLQTEPLRTASPLPESIDSAPTDSPARRREIATPGERAPQALTAASPVRSRNEPGDGAPTPVHSAAIAAAEFHSPATPVSEGPRTVGAPPFAVTRIQSTPTALAELAPLAHPLSRKSATPLSNPPDRFAESAKPGRPPGLAANGPATAQLTPRAITPLAALPLDAPAGTGSIQLPGTPDLALPRVEPRALAGATEVATATAPSPKRIEQPPAGNTAAPVDVPASNRPRLAEPLPDGPAPADSVPLAANPVAINATPAPPDAASAPRMVDLVGHNGIGRNRWRTTFPNLQHSGDWNCDRTAMLNLAHQVQTRTGSTLAFDSRELPVTDPDVHRAPFLFLSGHQNFHFSDAEIHAVRQYLENGGHLWINDSTDIGDTTFDTAVRRELGRLFPRATLRPIPPDHALFQAPYDLTQGFRGYPVPPGDKYRTDHLEGVWMDERLAVIYTRNDYGDGLEIDLRTAPAMQSLTDLSPRDMQEASVRMGTNIALFCINGGQAPAFRFPAQDRDNRPPPEVTRRGIWSRYEAHKLDLFADAAHWRMPPRWKGDFYLEATARPSAENTDDLVMEFRQGARPFTGWRSQGVLETSCKLPFGRRHVVVMDVVSHLPGGARVAIAFVGPGPTTYIESDSVFLRPGLNRNIAFPLYHHTFRTEAVHWEARAAWPDPMPVTEFRILVYPQGPTGSVEFRNLRLVTP